MSDLILERRNQPDETATVGNLMLTPPLGDDYWMYRVRVGHEQAVVGFPKFMTIGVGFAREEDWNTNLPYTTDAAEIFEHISHNKGNDSIPDASCVEAIRLIQQAVEADLAPVSA